MRPPLLVVDLGRLPYREALERQRAWREARLTGTLTADCLLLVEHDPVYTLGRGTRESSMPMPEEALRARGADVVAIERGGDITWHGPGQLVGYPILDLSTHRQDLHWYLRTLESVLIAALAAHGVTAGVIPGRTGVWVDDRKIASIGIHVRQWVTLHGFALNVDPALEWFDAIVPCGLHGIQMTSLARCLGAASPAEALHASSRAAVIEAFGEAFARTPRLLSAAECDFGPGTCDSGAVGTPFMSYG